MSRTVRPASPADAGSLAAIDVSVNINPWNARQFAAACSDANAKEQFAMVVEEDGRTDGFLVFSQVLDEASIYSIGVHSAQQGKGLGHLLLQAALLKMKEAGATRCFLEVRQSNAVARRLYKAMDLSWMGYAKAITPQKADERMPC